MSSFYDELEVSPKASPETIRAAYRSLIQRYHPDRHAGSRESALRTLRLNEAYAVLSDPVKRAAYDAKLFAEQEQRLSREREDAQGRSADQAAARAQTAARRTAADHEQERRPKGGGDQRQPAVERSDPLKPASPRRSFMRGLRILMLCGLALSIGG